MAEWSRYVALGDSTSEGLMDPYPDGSGYRGWTDRLAARLAAQRGAEPFLYANLAVRGKLARQVHAEQLDAALALEPDLATVVAGLNDVLRKSYDLDAVRGHMAAMFGALRAGGADVVTFTFPDPVPVNPIARPGRERVFAYNEVLRALGAEHGVIVVDLERHPVTSDPRLWHRDRLHTNGEGHRRIAEAIAAALGLPGGDPAWSAPLPAATRAGRVARAGAHARWAGEFFAPWVLRRLRGVSSGDGLTAKRPDLLPFAVPQPDQEP
jgi:lysophospholipase L1-like esterase